MNDEVELEDWPVPTADVRRELERTPPAWPEPDDERQALRGRTGMTLVRAARRSSRFGL